MRQAAFTWLAVSIMSEDVVLRAAAGDLPAAVVGVGHRADGVPLARVRRQAGVLAALVDTGLFRRAVAIDTAFRRRRRFV